MKSQILSLWLFGLTLAQGRTLGHAHAHAHARVHARHEELHLAHEAELDSTEPPVAFSEPEADTAHLNFLKAREYDELTGVPEDIIPSSSTVSVTTVPLATGTAVVLPSLSDVEPHTEGVVLTSLNATGRPTEARLLTSVIPEPTSLLMPLYDSTSTSLSLSQSSSKVTTSTQKGKPVPVGPTSKTQTSSSAAATSSNKGQRQAGSRLVKMAEADLFKMAIDTKAPPSTIKTRADHPVPRLGLTKNGPIQTNKFYSNFFLGDQQSPTFTFPYSIAWAAGSGASTSWGMSCSHIEAKQRVFGDKKFNNAAAYFINPIGIQSMVISAKELGKNTVVTVDSMTAFSARVNLAKDKNSAPAISFPVVQGMAYITAQFNGAVPIIQSGVYFKTMTRVTKDPKTNVAKYNFVLEDGTTWRLYAYKTKGDQLDLKVTNNGLAQSSKPFYGIIQVAKDPKTTGSEALLDDGAGIYPTTSTMSGYLVPAGPGVYTFSFTRAGHQTGNLYMYALPHHVASFDSETRGRVKSVKLQTTTKGIATLVSGNSWTMNEPVIRGLWWNIFAPWDASKGAMTKLSQAAINKIRPIALKEISQNIDQQTNLDSMYFSGKALAKFGTLLYVINDLLKDKDLAKAGLVKLKAAFATFAANKQKYPLVYESAWGGVVSSASYATGNSGADFGNTYYNDHHFHYGYHILAAAYIAYLDPTWIAANKDYVNTLCRDISNPTTGDQYFPQHRNFDWFHGHSWAHGLFAAWDGKDQESSSEDMMASYALLAWGKLTGNGGMANRALLQLAVQQRSMQSYYLYTLDNVHQPKEFIGNKVAGILFENKIDHTTYFSPDIEAIQGIHMIPLLPPSTQIRTKTFTQQEWGAFFSNGRIDKINNAWKSIIWGSYASVSPVDAWSYFSKANFDASLIDGGASLTWYMAYSAAMAGL